MSAAVALSAAGMHGWRSPEICHDWWLAVDEDLTTYIGKVADGDQAAFASLYDALAPTVYGVVRRVLRDPSQAEEVTQEIFVEIWKQAARYDAERAGVRTWAVTIAHRRAVDRVRSEQSHRDRQTIGRGGVARGAGDAGGRRDRGRGPATGAGGHGDAAGRPARGAGAGVLRRPHARADRRTPRHRARHREDRIRDGLIRLRTTMGACRDRR